MEKLKIEHLTSYLPYGLKVFRDCANSLLYNDAIVEVDCIGYIDKVVTFNTGADYYFEDEEIDFTIKPLLLPLSEWRTIENGEFFFSPFFHSMQDMDGGIEHNLMSAPYYDLQLLFVNHFDVFGLIDRGLALNKRDYDNR